MLRDALLIHHRLADRWRTASVLEEIAGSLMIRLDEGLAATLLGAADRLRERTAAPISPVEAADRDHALARLRRSLGEVGFTSGFDAGRCADLDAVVAQVVDALERAEPASPDGAAQRIASVLTAREMGVLELLSAGATNREIAEDLYISATPPGCTSPTFCASSVQGAEWTRSPARRLSGYSPTGPATRRGPATPTPSAPAHPAERAHVTLHGRAAARRCGLMTFTRRFSDLILTLWGQAGRHARSAIGADELPMGMSIEVEATVTLA